MYWWMCNITPQITLATNCGHPISENNIINHRLIPICSNYDSVSLGPRSWFFKHPWICERHAQPKESKYVCLSILLVSVSLNLDDFPCRNAHNPSAFTLPSNCQPLWAEPIGRFKTFVCVNTFSNVWVDIVLDDAMRTASSVWWPPCKALRSSSFVMYTSNSQVFWRTVTCAKEMRLDSRRHVIHWQFVLLIHHHMLPPLPDVPQVIV